MNVIALEFSEEFAGLFLDYLRTSSLASIEDVEVFGSIEEAVACHSSDQVLAVTGLAEKLEDWNDMMKGKLSFIMHNQVVENPPRDFSQFISPPKASLEVEEFRRSQKDAPDTNPTRDPSTDDQMRMRKETQAALDEEARMRAEIQAALDKLPDPKK